MNNQLEKTEPDIQYTCCFTGLNSRKLPPGCNESSEVCKRIKHRLEQEMIRMITEQQVSHFISALSPGCNTWAAETVLSLREKFPYITVECVRPCETQADRWTVEKREQYYSIMERCSKETLLQKHYTRGCMEKQDRYMVDRSAYVLAVWDGSPGRAANTIRYARSRNKDIRIIDPNGR